MTLRFSNGEPSNHPITQLEYATEIERFRFGSHEISVQRLKQVEQAIDLVFDWLDQRGLPADEIECLAPYFGAVWPSALALASYVAQEGELGRLKGRSVLEVGCGLGVPGLVAAKYGADVAMSDGHPDVPRFLEANIALNGSPDIEFMFPDWKSGQLPNRQFEFVIASDVLYEPQHAELFSNVLTRHACHGAKIVLADPGRAYIQRFVNHMKDFNWVETLTPWTVRHSGKYSDVFLLSFEQRD